MAQEIDTERLGGAVREAQSGRTDPIADVFVWDRQFETGIAEIDSQHQKLVQLINLLGKILATETDTASFVKSLFGVFDELAEYVDYHFNFEEKLMESFRIEEAHDEIHKNAHADFIRTITEARLAANDRPAEVTGETLTYLSRWLMTHIVGTDMRMAKKILAIQSGIAEDEASALANSFMNNTSEALLLAMNRLYENMARRTQDLLEVKRRLDQEIEMRKQKEAELRKLSRAVEHSPVSIIITNSNGEFEYINPKFEQQSGYSMSDLTGKTPRVLKSGDMAATFFADMWATISSGKEWHGEIHNRSKNGAMYWDYAAISPVFDANGQITHFVSIQENITERKLAEESLRQQKQFSDDIINNLPGIFYMLDQQGRLVRINPKLMEVSGYERHELSQMTALDFFDGGDRRLIEAQIRYAFENGQSSTEAEIITKSGQRIPYYFTGHRTQIEGRYYLVGLGTDISKRKLLEQELSRQARTDSLTGLSNRRHFIELAEQELLRSQRYRNLLSLMMLDLDEFKAVNDTYGHEVGDDVLRKVGEICRQVLRGIDIVGRIGGEEFAILLPETHSKQAFEAAERLCNAIAQAGIVETPTGAVQFTASIGVTTLSPDNASINQLLRQADKALYEAKRMGRNRVCVA